MNKLPSIWEKNNESNEIIRISVANLVALINWRIVGIVNKKRFNLWMKNIWLIGGWAALFNRILVEDLGGFDFEKEDVRFKIDSEMFEHVVRIFTQANYFLYERAILRELIEELSKELIWNMTEPILSRDECYEFTPEFIGTVYSEGYWSSEKREILTKYIWHLFSLKCPDHIIQKLIQHEIIYFLDKEDFEREETHDWFSLWPNIFTVKEFLEWKK